ncbi:MAG: sensor histidine kinase, partial [Propionibacteriaceae bacterium]|nr:sensor histidine kinase [Propionibacteriaceae bacterium]
MRQLVRNPWLGSAGYLMAALGVVVYLYGQVTPFASYGHLLGIRGAPASAIAALLAIPVGGVLATSSALQDAERRVAWRAHRFDYFFVLVGAIVAGTLAVGILEWGRGMALVHLASLSVLVALVGYCWETTLVRWAGRTLRATICWPRILGTLPVRQFSGAFILIVVVLASVVLLFGLVGAVDAAIVRTDYNDSGYSAWLAGYWIPAVLLPGVVLAVVASLGQNIVTVTADRQRAIEAQLREERFRAELITNVTHDLRTPLTSIINYADLIGRQPATDPNLGEYAAVLGRKAERLRVLIGDLLDASRASAGAVPVRLEPIELTEILGQVAGDFDAAFAARELEWVSPPVRPCLVTADGAHLWRILENLVGNVVKYARPGSVVRAEVLALPGAGAIRLGNRMDAPLAVAPEALTAQFV